MHGGLREKRRKPNRTDIEGISQAHHSVCIIIREKEKLVQHQMTMCLERVFQEMGAQPSRSAGSLHWDTGRSRWVIVTAEVACAARLLAHLVPGLRVLQTTFYPFHFRTVFLHDFNVMDAKRRLSQLLIRQTLGFLRRLYSRSICAARFLLLCPGDQAKPVLWFAGAVLHPLVHLQPIICTSDAVSSTCVPPGPGHPFHELSAQIHSGKFPQPFWYTWRPGTQRTQGYCE